MHPTSQSLVFDLQLILAVTLWLCMSCYCMFAQNMHSRLPMEECGTEHTALSSSWHVSVT